MYNILFQLVKQARRF